MVSGMTRRYKYTIQKGFTLVEMMAVILVMSILLGATAWGVTGWIQHFTYIKNEETARHIYLGAQSGLSAYEGRGTLDELFREIENNTNGLVEYVGSEDNSDLATKKMYGLPIEPDIKGVYHKYAILKCKSKKNGGGIDSNPNSALYKLVRPYVADTESLDGSIALELDMTAKKVYAVFYSSWATDYNYGTDTREIRGEYGVYREYDTTDPTLIAMDTREPAFRSDCCVGYYGTDQVNVAHLSTLTSVNMEYAELYNDETLHLDFRSDAGMIEENTAYRIEIYQKSPTTPANDKKLFTVALDPSAAFDNHELLKLKADKKEEEYPALVSTGIRTVKQLQVTDSAFGVDGNYWFYVDYKKQTGDPDDPATGWNLSLMLDCQADSATLAHPDQPLKKKTDIDPDNAATTDKVDLNQDETMSITRLIGDNPRLIYAKVYVGPNARGNALYSASVTPITTRPQNDLLATDLDNNDVAQLTPGDYTVVTPRHFSNIRYAERNKLGNSSKLDDLYTYHLAEDLYWENAKVFSLYASESGGTYEQGFLKDNETNDIKKTFATIPKLSAGSILDGDGHAFYNLVMDNTSYVEYTGSSHDENKAEQIGIFGESYGTIQRLVLRNASMSLLSNAEKTQSVRAKSGDDGKTVNKTIFGDNIHAAGILCGRDYGNMQEIYLDDECKLNATIFELDTLDKTKGSGIGMLAGTVSLSNSHAKNQIHDRLRTGGAMTGKLGKKTNHEFTAVPTIHDTSRGTVLSFEYDNTAAGYENASKQYAYGMGGVFGYVYAELSKNITLAEGANGNQYDLQPVLGLTEDAVKEKAKKSPAQGGYSDNVKTQQSVSGNDAWPDPNPIGLRYADPTGTLGEADRKMDKYENVFKDWTWSVESHVTVNDKNVTSDVQFVGGILGNMQLALSENVRGQMGDKTKDDNGNGDPTIPGMEKGYYPQIAGCRNYGSVFGGDLVGGIIGLNCPGAFIDDCANYGNMMAVDGVSAGISAENFGYMRKCRVDRAGSDDKNDDGYCPVLEGNEEAAGMITSVSYSDAVLMDCEIAATASSKILLKDNVAMSDTKIITVLGNDIKTIGYIAGENYGVIDGGLIGKYLGFESEQENLTIGGVAGINHSGAVVKNIESAFEFMTNQASYVGGVVGENNGTVRTCMFSGSISQLDTERSLSGTRYGGIAAINRKTGTKDAVIQNCYLVGSRINARGFGTFTSEDSDATMINRSSAIGGVCGANEKNAVIADCYVAAHYDIGPDGKPKKDSSNHDVMESATLDVRNGLVGGITGLNAGDLVHCGYTDKVILIQSDMDNADESTLAAWESNSVKRIVPVKGRIKNSVLCQRELLGQQGSNMAFFDESAHYLEQAMPDATLTSKESDKYSYVGTTGTQGTENSWENERASYLAAVNAISNGYIKNADDDDKKQTEKTTAAAELLRRQMMEYNENDPGTAAKKPGGLLVDETGHQDEGLELTYANNKKDVLNALPREKTAAISDWNVDPIDKKYDARYNAYIISSRKGVSHVGGITGYNGSSGNLRYCATGSWLVESYLPQRQYTYTGGIVGKNASDGEFSCNVNFAYVRRELEPISDSLHASLTDEYTNFHKYQYVGGVIGSQKNTTSGTWAVRGCANAGKVVNMFGNNVSGVISQLTGNGGAIEECFNFGTLVTGYSDDFFRGYGNERKDDNSGWNGTAGGVIGHMIELDLHYPVNIRYCQNHGIVNLPMRGYNRSTRTLVNSTNSVYLANDVGGVVGEVSSTNVEQVYVINIEDCLNGWDAEVYGHGSTAGIVGYVGGFSKLGGGKKEANSIVLNIYTCRNYSSEIHTITGHSGGGKLNADKTAGVLAGLQRENKGVGYISMRDNLSVRMGDSSAPTKKLTRVLKGAQKSYFTMSGYNFYVDNTSFQYLSYVDGTDDAEGNPLQVIANLQTNNKKKDATVQKSQPASATDLESAELTNVSFTASDKLDYLGEAADRYVNANRLYGVTLTDGTQRKTGDSHALIWLDEGYQINNLDAKNSYMTEAEYPVIMQNSYKSMENATLHQFGDVVYQFTEKTKSGQSYTNPLANPLTYMRNVRDGNITGGSRMPFSDEFDMVDLYDLDRNYVRYAEYKNSSLEWPDKIENVHVEQDKENGNYKATWDVKSPDGAPITSAKQFDVVIEYYKTKDSDFDLSKYTGDDFNPENSLYTGSVNDDNNKKPAWVVRKKTDAKVLTFDFEVPEDVTIDPDCTYYAVVRVRDARASEAENPAEQKYSEVKKGSLQSNGTYGKYTAFVKLKRKLKVPEFEIVEYGGKWMLHLKNEDAYKTDIESNNADFKVGAYILDKGTSFGYSMDGSELTMDKDSELLTNIVDCTEHFATGTKDLVLRIYAEASDAMPSDYATMTVYVPRKADPTSLACAYEKTSNSKPGSKKPSFGVQIHYQQFDTDDETEVSPIAQVFRVELYGIKKNSDGDVIAHETVAMKEYALTADAQETADSTVNLAIGYYDVPSASGINLEDYDDFDVDVWYASPGQGEVYNYFETPKGYAEGQLRPTGYFTVYKGLGEDGEKVYEYYHRTKGLEVPECEIVAYGDQWMLHLTNPEVFEPFTKMDGFEVGAYLIVNGNKMPCGRIQKDSIVTKETEVTHNKAPLSDNCLNSNATSKLVFYAAANGMRTTTSTETEVFIPKVTDPDEMDYTLTDTADSLNDPAARSYSGTIHYVSYGKDKNSDAITPPEDTPQKFIVEVYGTTVSGNGTPMQKTFYWNEVDLKAGAEADVTINRDDLLATDEELAGYTNLHAVVWYAETGIGPVKTYFETTKEAAGENTLRKTGFITCAGEEGERYYYHPDRVTELPEIDIVRLTREGDWYARLKNPEKYDGMENVAIGLRYKDDENDTSHTKTLEGCTQEPKEGVLVYGVGPLAFTGTKLLTGARASADGYFASGYKNYDTPVTLYADLETEMNISLKELEGETLTLNDSGELRYQGTLHYSVGGEREINAYYRRELYAKDSAGKDVTLFMDETDRLLDPQTSDDATGNQAGLDLGFTVSGNDVNVLDYHDYHMAVWFSGYEMKNASESPKVVQYFSVSDQVAAQNGYSRSKGIIKYIGSDGGSEETDGNPAYYYAAPVKDRANYESATYCLYRECPLSIARVDSVQGDGYNHATWTVDENVSDTNTYDIKISYYRTNEGEEVTYENGNLTVSENSVIERVAEKTLKNVTGNSIEVPLPASEDYIAPFDALGDDYDYYVTLRVISSSVVLEHEDSDMARALIAAYAGNGYLKFLPKLPVPKLQISRLNNGGSWNWYLHLLNPEDYKQGDGWIRDNLEIHASVYGKNYTISLGETVDEITFNNNAAVEYVCKTAVTNTGGEKAGVMTVWASAGTEESRKAESTVYIPNGSTDTPGNNNSKVRLNNAGWRIEGNQIKVEGQAKFTGAAVDESVPTQRFRIALIYQTVQNNKYYNTILAHTEEDQDIFMKVNGDYVPIDSTIEIPAWNLTKAAETEKVKLMLYYLDNDPASDQVTHQTKLTLHQSQNSSDGLGLQYIFRDNTKTDSENRDDWEWYFISTLNEHGGLAQGAEKKNMAVIPSKN